MKKIFNQSYKNYKKFCLNEKITKITKEELDNYLQDYLKRGMISYNDLRSYAIYKIVSHNFNSALDEMTPKKEAMESAIEWSYEEINDMDSDEELLDVLTDKEKTLFHSGKFNTAKLIINAIDSYLSSIKARHGLYDYKVVCDDTNNSAEDIDNYLLYVDTFLKPTRAIEFIKVRSIITKTGANFSEVLV